MNYTRYRMKVLSAFFAFYFYTVGVFFFNHLLLSQVRPIFFTYNRDLSELLVIGTGLPKLMMAHPGMFLMADLLLVILPVFLLLFYIWKGKFSFLLGLSFALFLALYLLLLNIFTQAHQEPTLIYFLLSLAFISNRERPFYRVINFCRFYFLYIFFSAAFWKIARGAVFNPEEMSNILLSQHADVLASGCSSFSCRTYLYLIAHPVLSYLLYLAGVLLEASFAVGFFTRKFDKVLFFIAVLFFALDLWVMRISYWPIMVGGMLLLLPSVRKSKRRSRRASTVKLNGI